MNDDDKDEALSADEVTRYRRIAARANFLAQDMMDIAYATKEATRRMTAPTTDDWNKLVRLGRYFAQYPRVVKRYKCQNESEKVVACTDSHLAQCRRTRRSTSGGCIHRGQHMLKFWRKTQAVVAQSSAEAEMGAAMKASQEVLGMMSLWKGVGETTSGNVMGDVSAAIGRDASAVLGIFRRMGLGKVRHLLWVQEKEASRELQYHKINGSDNSADLFTKALDHDSIHGHTQSMGFEFMSERDPFAFTANNMSATRHKKNGRVDKNGHAQQDLQDHKQGRIGLERCCIQGDC